MSKPEILQLGEYPEADEALLNEHFVMHRFFEVEDKAAYLRTHGEKIQGIATRGDLSAPAEIIDALPNLEIISVYGVGYDGVDLQAAARQNARVTNTPDVLTGDVADYAIAMMLAQSREVVKCDQWVRDGKWSPQSSFGLTTRVHGKRAGVLGLGRIGLAIAKRLAAFDMQVFYSSTCEKPAASRWTYVPDAVSLASEVDFLFIACAATPETKHVVNREVIEALGPHGMVINISRAQNIDESALLDALEDGRLGAAALDVFEGEPDLNPRFLSLDNVLLQPHQGSGTVETRRAMGDLMRENLIAHFSGKPLLTPVA